LTVGSPRHPSVVIEKATKTATPWDTVSPLIAEEVRRIQDEIGMAILKERFRQLLEEGHEESISAGGTGDPRLPKRYREEGQVKPCQDMGKWEEGPSCLEGAS